MRAISLTQPWATLLTLGAERGGKGIETRSWPAPAHVLPALGRHERIAIHAAKGFPRACRELCDEEPFRSALYRAGVTSWQQLPIGAIVGDCLVDACLNTDRLLLRGITATEEAFGDYGPDRYGWITSENRSLLTPIPCKGALGLWTVPLDIAAAVTQAIEVPA